MATIAVIYESRYGQTQKIAQHLQDRAQREGHDARMVRASLATHATIDDADAFVVVAPVYFGRHADAARKFVRTYAATLGRRPVAFVSVSNSAAHPDPKAKENAKHIAERDIRAGGVHPAAVICTAGALAYPRYGFWIRQMMRVIAKSTGGPTDTRRTHELTDWTALDRDIAPFFALSALDRGQSGPSKRQAPAVTAD